MERLLQRMQPLGEVSNSLVYTRRGGRGGDRWGHEAKGLVALASSVQHGTLPIGGPHFDHAQALRHVQHLVGTGHSVHQYAGQVHTDIFL